MLNTFLRTSAIFSLFIFASLAQAQNIAVVNLQAVFLEADYTKAQFAELRADPTFASVISDTQTLVADMQALNADAEANSDSWSQEQVAEYNKQRQYLIADINLNQQKMQQEEEALLSQIEAVLSQPISEAIDELVKEEGITLLLRETAVYYASDVHDVTAKLVEKLND